MCCSEDDGAEAVERRPRGVRVEAVKIVGSSSLMRRKTGGPESVSTSHSQWSAKCSDGMSPYAMRKRPLKRERGSGPHTIWAAKPKRPAVCMARCAAARDGQSSILENSLCQNSMRSVSIENVRMPCA